MAAYRGDRVEDHRRATGEEIGVRRRAALVRHVLHLGLGHAHEELGRHVQRAARPARSVDRLVGIRLDPAHQLGNRFCADGRVHRQQQRHDVRVHHRLEVLDRVERHLLEQPLVGGVAGGDDHQRCSRRAGSWRRSRCRGCSTPPACSRPPPAGRARSSSFRPACARSGRWRRRAWLGRRCARCARDRAALPR